ncbi:hypothetical protein AAF712_014272 [Marasmius tenuissimus]|uniref:Enoyl-CoA hydratase n=1 Tax=Marasmius tenuissimus TaxID=585030 RepID=A0ABR2ZDG4_9AGAR
MAKSSSEPPKTTQLIVSFPSSHVVLLTFNRPDRLNAMSPQLAQDLESVLDWFEKEEESLLYLRFLSFSIVGSMDVRADAPIRIASRPPTRGGWCRWNEAQKSGSSAARLSPQHGFGSLSRRQLRKPIIAAVNGIGSWEELRRNLICSTVISVSAYTAKSAFQRAGHQLASEMLLTGRNVTAQEAYERFGFVNAVVSSSSLLSTAISYAEQIIANSPDSVQTTKVGLLLAQKYDPENAYDLNLAAAESTRMYRGENIKVGFTPLYYAESPVTSTPRKDWLRLPR